MLFVFYVESIPFDECKLVAARMSDPASYDQQQNALITCQLQLIDRLVNIVDDMRSELREVKQHQNEQPNLLYTWIFSSFYSFITFVIVMVWFVRTLDYNARLKSLVYCRVRMMVSSYQHLKRCNFPSQDDAVNYRNFMSVPRFSPKICCCTRKVVTMDDISLD